MTGPASGATVFPQPLGLAATMDTDLLGAVGTAISDESRALSNAAVFQNNGAVPGYLNCWAPNMNIFRDPRWGRGSETYGEDPHLTSELLAAYVHGVEGTAAQKKAAQYTKVISVCKHFMAYSLEEAEGQSRFWFDANVTAADLADTYAPAFEACVKAGAGGIMCRQAKVFPPASHCFYVVAPACFFDR